MALRNLEEQVLYLTNELEKIKQSLGNALPDPIPGPQGEPGEQGEQGVQGVQGYGIIGNGTQLPSYASNGNYFILRTSGIDGIDLVLYKCISGHWVAQYSLRGNQGPVGDSADVTANPDSEYSEDLYKLKVDGVTYNVLTSGDRTKLEKITLSGGLYATFTYSSVDFNGTVNFNNTTTFKANAIVQSGHTFGFNNGSYLRLAGLGQVVNAASNPLIICENFTDSHIRNRFVEGNITTSTITGVTFTYAKWSLSGSHLMIVVVGQIEENTAISFGTWGDLMSIPSWIRNKIVPTFSDIVDLKDTYLWKDDWNVQQIGFCLAIGEGYFNLVQFVGDTINFDGQFRIQFDLLIDMD